MELQTQEELECVLHHEKLLWKQKTRCDWLYFGDRNTNFFHSRRKHNEILTLKNEEGEWAFEDKVLQSEAIKFFQKFYGEILDRMTTLPTSSFPKLDLIDVLFLKREVPNKGIKNVLFNKAHLKAPSGDGYLALFFQSQWELIGGGICEWIKKIFGG